MRTVTGVRTVERLAESPWGKQRLTGVAAEGKRYEKRVAKALPLAWHNPWFRFTDALGPACCSPDIVFRTPQGIFCVECKLTYTDTAQAQLSQLYIPVLSHFFSAEVFGIVCIRGLGRANCGIRTVSTLKVAIKDSLLLAPSGPWPVVLVPALSPAHLKAQLSLSH